MTLIRKWALALCSALLFINCSVSKAQESVTSNIINGNWSGVSYGTHPGDCCTGGPNPLYDTNNGMIHFSWGQGTASQIIAINQILSGQGIQITGYNYSWWLRNLNGTLGVASGIQDPLSATVTLYNNSNTVISQQVYNYNYWFDWSYFSGTHSYNSPYDLNKVGNLSLSFSGKDSGFWAGYYGPQVYAPSVSLNYSVKQTPANNSSTPITPNTASLDPTKIDATLTDVGGLEMSTTGSLQTPDNIPQVVKETRKTNSTGIGLSVIAKNREREQAIVNRQLELTTESNEQLALSFTRAGSILGVDSNSLTNPTNPIGNLMNNTPRPLESNQSESTNSTVKKNVPNNDLAGGVNINQLAQTPAGFDAYMGIMPDGRLYEPREIYRGQRNVDNARATRFLSGANDALHQLMIEQQYNIGR